MSTPPTDADLIRWAAEPPEDLFPLFRRASSLWPLAVVIAFLPGLVAFVNSTAETGDALWSLRALDALAAESWSDWIFPGVTAHNAVGFQPPLMTWLTAIWLGWVGTRNDALVYVVPYLAASIANLLCYALAWRLAGPRLAFLTIVIVAFHGQQLAGVQSLSSESLELATWLVCIDAYIRHESAAHHLFSSWLLVSGVALGLAFLAGGPAAIALVALMLTYTVLTRTRDSGATSQQPLGGAIFSVLIVLAIGLVVGGWWEPLVMAQFGGEALTCWLVGSWVDENRSISLLAAAVDETRRDHVIRNWLVWHGSLIGWQFLGLASLLSTIRSGASDAAKKPAILIVVWFGLGTVLWLLSILAASIPGLVPLRWQMFLLFPGVMLAATGCNDVIERRVRGLWLAVAVGLSGVWLLWAGSVSSEIRLSGSWAIVYFTYLLCAIGLVWWRFSRLRKEKNRRRVLQAVSLGMVLVHLAWADATLHLPDEETQRLVQMKSRLMQVQQVAGAVVVAPKCVVPPQVVNLVRCLWPEASLEVTEIWHPSSLASFSLPPGAKREQYLVLDWSRRDLVIPMKPNSGWQVKPLADPIRYQGRKLSAQVLLPQGMHVSLGWAD